MSAVALFVGTRKGLFRASSDGTRSRFTLDGPHIAGYEILHTCASVRSPGTVYAAARHAVWGAHVYRSRDGGATWESLSAAPHHADGRYGETLRAIWYLAESPDGERLYAGIDPAGLFVSSDEGASWSPVDGLNAHPTRERWEPARGGFSVHSICCDPQDAHRLYAAVSAGGAFRSEDGGRSWTAANAGVRAENRPERFPEVGHNIHRLVLHPAAPRRLYRQCYNGTYRSDDGARTWIEITEGLPSDFGYALACAPVDPDTVFQVPESGSHMRTAVAGRLRVYRSRNAGADWQPLTHGLPQEHAWVSVLREAMDTDDLEPCGVYLGTSGGHLFASADAGEHWQQIAGFLPRVLSVKAVRLPT